MTSTCDSCGYRPHQGDAFPIVLDTGKDSKGVTIHYVRCYQCGAEWVE